MPWEDILRGLAAAGEAYLRLEIPRRERERLLYYQLIREQLQKQREAAREQAQRERMLELEELRKEKALKLEELREKRALELEKLRKEKALELEKLRAERALGIEELRREREAELERLRRERALELEELRKERALKIEELRAKRGLEREALKERLARTRKEEEKEKLTHLQRINKLIEWRRSLTDPLFVGKAIPTEVARKYILEIKDPTERKGWARVFQELTGQSLVKRRLTPMEIQKRQDLLELRTLKQEGRVKTKKEALEALRKAGRDPRLYEKELDQLFPERPWIERYRLPKIVR